MDNFKIIALQPGDYNSMVGAVGCEDVMVAIVTEKPVYSKNIVNIELDEVE